MQSKKGAIELSMTTIIVIILGVALLTLGLVFVRGTFLKITDLTEGEFAKASKEIQDHMGATEKINVGGLRWEVEPGKPIARAVGIKFFDDNPSATATFKVEINPTADRGSKDWFTISEPGKLKAGDQSIVPVEVKIPSSVPPGSSYSFLVVVSKENVEYASQPIIVSVKE